MFVGHYGPSFAIKAIRPAIPLWLVFIAVQLVDFAWAVLVLLGIEKVRIVPGITASNPLDLYYMPYTQSLVAAVLWAVAAIVLCKPLCGVRNWSAAAWIGAAVFSHWVLDWLVHRPDLPLYDDAMKVGLGIWNFRRSQSGASRECALMAKRKIENRLFGTENHAPHCAVAIPARFPRVTQELAYPRGRSDDAVL
jgi:hypothetical protein